MVDGFQMSRRGEAARVLSAAISTSWVNGLIWGLAVFLFLPWYTQIVLYFGTVEMFSFLIFAMVCVIFVSSKYWFRGLLALILGVMVGRIGMDQCYSPFFRRYTFGWDYLGDGVQIIPIMAGLLAFRTIQCLQNESRKNSTYKRRYCIATYRWYKRYMALEMGRVTRRANWWLCWSCSGIGGAIADWFAYSQTVAVSKKVKKIKMCF